MKNIFENVLFAVSREDHEVEASLIKKNNYKNLLTVCSGGCVPLSLKTIFPDLNIDLKSILSFWPRHIKSFPVLVNLILLQFAQKLLLKGVINPIKLLDLFVVL